jgi:hypothetical protein
MTDLDRAIERLEIWRERLSVRDKATLLAELERLRGIEEAAGAHAATLDRARPGPTGAKLIARLEVRT